MSTCSPGSPDAKSPYTHWYSLPGLTPRSRSHHDVNASSSPAEDERGMNERVHSPVVYQTNGIKSPALRGTWFTMPPHVSPAAASFSSPVVSSHRTVEKTQHHQKGSVLMRSPLYPYEKCQEPWCIYLYPDAFWQGSPCVHLQPERKTIKWAEQQHRKRRFYFLSMALPPGTRVSLYAYFVDWQEMFCLPLPLVDEAIPNLDQFVKQNLIYTPHCNPYGSGCYSQWTYQHVQFFLAWHLIK